MIAADTVALVLLAAGRSRRFGDVDKLAEPFLGKPLAFHVVTALEDVPFLCRIAVVSGTGLDFAARGYLVTTNDVPETGLSGSVRLGVERAREAGAAAVLIALADMPRVTAGHVYRLLETAAGDDAVVASSDGVTPCPPAVFGHGRFASLTTLGGNFGARGLIRAGHHVVATKGELIDIDTPLDLARLRGLVQAQDAVARARARRSDEGGSL